MKTNFGLLNARLLQEGPTAMWAREAKKTATITTSSSTTQVWQRGSVSYTRKHNEGSIWRGNPEGATGGRKHPVLCKSSRLDSINVASIIAMEQVKGRFFPGWPAHGHSIHVGILVLIFDYSPISTILMSISREQILVAAAPITRSIDR